MASYTGNEGSSLEESRILLPQDTPNESQDLELSQGSTSHVSDSSNITLSPSHREKGSKGDNAIAANVLDACASQIQKSVTELKSECAGTDFSSKFKYLEGKLVEGNSVKSQSRSWKLHDLSGHTGGRNHLEKKDKDIVYPSSSSGSGGGGHDEELWNRGVQSPKQSTQSSLQSSVTGTSCRTTASEAEFRSDLASLDADIARLQMQFRVAMLTPLP